MTGELTASEPGTGASELNTVGHSMANPMPQSRRYCSLNDKTRAATDYLFHSVEGEKRSRQSRQSGRAKKDLR